MNYIKSKNLSFYNHGFFSRLGGISQSYYSSLNCGFSSSDKENNVKRNREIIAKCLNIKLKSIIIPNQFHSNKVEIFKKNQSEYKCDAIINTIPGIALGILTADCCPILVGHKNNALTGIIHAGWKGVHKGIIENFLNEMKNLNYNKDDLLFSLGPTIGKSSYEVTLKFKENFLQNYKNANRFFSSKKLKNRFNFNLRGCILWILKRNGISDVWTSRVDTYRNPKKYFSYRYSVHNKYEDYGRMLSLIVK